MHPFQEGPEQKKVFENFSKHVWLILLDKPCGSNNSTKVLHTNEWLWTNKYDDINKWNFWVLTSLNEWKTYLSVSNKDTLQQLCTVKFGKYNYFIILHYFLKVLIILNDNKQ
jgi:hypothetical protein